MFPDVNFFGVDRSSKTKELNERYFSADNISFYGMDICDFLESHGSELNNGLLVHQRVRAVLYPEKIRLLYRACYENNIGTILCLEPIGFSRTTNSFFKFSIEHNESVVFRAPLIMHNYPNLLLEAGYRCVDVEAMEYPHPHEDIRILKIVAVKDKLSENIDFN